MANKEYEFTLGADPEFVFTTDGGTFVRAKNVIDDDYEGHNGLMGYDGESGVGPAELRPIPAATPAKLVDNMQYCMQHGLTRFPESANYLWRAGSAPCGVAIGGHIHIGMKHILAKKRVSLDSLTRWLDLIVATPTLLVEVRAESLQRRANTKYGHIGDYRTEGAPWGMEYRTLSSWLTYPEVALSVISLTYAAIWEYLNVGVKISELPAVEKMRWNNYEETYVKNLANYALAKIPQLVMFEKYREEIEFLTRHLIGGNKTWYLDGDQDIKKLWGLKLPNDVAAEKDKDRQIMKDLFGQDMVYRDRPARVQLPAEWYNFRNF